MGSPNHLVLCISENVSGAAGSSQQVQDAVVTILGTQHGFLVMLTQVLGV